MDLKKKRIFQAMLVSSRLAGPIPEHHGISPLDSTQSEIWWQHWDGGRVFFRAPSK